jgi:uncharacterized protein (TIGR00369 family)
MLDLPLGADPTVFVRLALARGHCQLLNLSLSHYGDDWCELTMPYADRLAGDTESGIIASGPIFALLDMASGMSIGFANGALKPRVTLDLRVDYLRPAKPGSAIIGRSHCYRRTKSVAFVRGFAHDGDAERPVAQMAGTFMFLEDTPETEQP